MDYIKGPWTAVEMHPSTLRDVAIHRISDQFGIVIAKVAGAYIPAPDTPTVEDHMNLWRNTVRIIRFAPDMYDLLKKLRDSEISNTQLQEEIRLLLSKVEGEISDLDERIQSHNRRGVVKYGS